MKLKNHKAAGPDNIPAEILNYEIDTVEKPLYQMLTKVWKTEGIPQAWKEGLIIKLSKKRDLSQCTNWRGITLLNVIDKILAQIILTRILYEYIIEPNRQPNQAGFRPTRSCIVGINTQRIIME